MPKTVIRRPAWALRLPAEAAPPRTSRSCKPRPTSSPRRNDRLKRTDRYPRARCPWALCTALEPRPPNHRHVPHQSRFGRQACGHTQDTRHTKTSPAKTPKTAGASGSVHPRRFQALSIGPRRETYASTFAEPNKDSHTPTPALSIGGKRGTNGTATSNCCRPHHCHTPYCAIRMGIPWVIAVRLSQDPDITSPLCFGLVCLYVFREPIWRFDHATDIVTQLGEQSASCKT